MKKIILLLLLLIPFNASASRNIEINLECDQNEYKINELISCKINAENPNKVSIKDVYFKTTNKLNNMLVLPGNTLVTANNGYQVSLENDNSTNFEILSFDIEIDNHDYELVLSDIRIILNDNSTKNINDIKKTFTIKKNEYLSSVIINNQELPNFEYDKYDYDYDIYTNSQIIDIRANAYDGYKVLEDYNHKLFNINDKVIKIKVSNEINEIKEYTINLNVLNDNSKLLKNVDITEIDFKFNPYKFDYYFQVPYEINGLSFNYDINSLENSYEIDKARLNIGDNIIRLRNTASNITYKFHVKRLEEGLTVDDSLELKSLRIGKTYINLKDDVFVYNISKVENPIVELKTTIDNQDYDVTYSDAQVKINIYSLTGEINTYTINLDDDEKTITPVGDYDKTTNVIIVCIFAALVILISLIVFKKEKEYRKNF